MHPSLLSTAILCAVSTVVLSAAKDGDENPKYWRAILGDICQLPSFPRATGDPTRYVECVRQSDIMSDRKDLGIWLLRECLPGYEFVASSRRCKTARSIERQQALCDSANATKYQFCPPKDAAQIQIEEIREAPKQCACPNGELNCVCPTPEILVPVAVPVNSNSRRRSPASSQGATLTFSQYPSCPCPSTQPSCYCVQLTASSQPSVASSNCCPQTAAPVMQTAAPVYQQPQQQQQCVCTPTQIQQQPVPAPQPINCQTTTTQQQYCPTPQRDQTGQVIATATAAVINPQPCPLVQGGVANAQYQGICSWMIDPLATDPQSRTMFLQCQPAPNNLFCGRWQRMPCAPGTVFDVNAQVCVWDSNSQPGNIPQPQPGTLPPVTAAPFLQTMAPVRQLDQTQAYNNQCACTGGVQIGSCNANYQCPGQSVCQVGMQNSQPCTICCYFRKKHRV